MTERDEETREEEPSGAEIADEAGETGAAKPRAAPGEAAEPIHEDTSAKGDDAPADEVAADEAAAEDAAVDEADAEDAATAEKGAKDEELADDAAALAAEMADLKDKLLRALAETENVRRRAERDRRDVARYAIAGFAREMLAVADNLSRALESVSEDDRSPNEALNAVVSGVELTEREMLSAFEREGIQPIEALGQKFDHNVHEAMFELEDSSNLPGTIVHVLEKGYMLNDRLLRPARVGIAKSGEAPPAPVDEEALPQPANEPGAEPATKGTAKAYEKQVDARGKKKSSGSQVDEKH
jgi:molecular chaperone GrpE